MKSNYDLFCGFLLCILLIITCIGAWEAKFEHEALLLKHGKLLTKYNALRIAKYPRWTFIEERVRVPGESEKCFDRIDTLTVETFAYSTITCPVYIRVSGRIDNDKGEK